MLLKSYLIGIAGSLTADWLGQAGAWALTRSPVAKAIDDTAQRYGSTERRRVREALERWVESGAFAALLSGLRAGEREGISERFRASFRERGGYREMDPDGTRTARVLNRFVPRLRARLLEAGRLDLLDVHIDAVGQRLQEGQERLHEDHLTIIGYQEEIIDRLDGGPVALTPEQLDEAERRFDAASHALLAWPTTTAGVWLDRPELGHILDRVATEDTSVTLLEGPRGTGKSALLAAMAARLREAEVAIVAVKADALPLALTDADDMVPDVPGGTVRAVRELAARQPVVVVLDQLDALSDVSDMRSGRLNAVLDVVDRLRGAVGVSVVASVRPFERSVDTRLQSSFRDVVTLAPPAWDDVRPLLAAAGHNADVMGDELRELLRVPEFLRVYLQMASPNQTYASWNRLYDAYWQGSVLGSHPDAAPLVHRLVDWMSEEEALWAPSSLVDDHPEAYQALLRADVLVRDRDRVGFRHQALFEFARARGFASGARVLTDYVRERESGLFVRPVLIAGLTALRGSSPRRYGEAIETFLNGTFRPHVEQLVGEYVAAQGEPTDEELATLLPRLDGPRARQTFVAMRGSEGWFHALVEGGVLAREMQRAPDQALPMLGLLVAASTRGDGETVFELVREHWLGDPAYDEYSLSALDDIPVWPPTVTRAMMEVAPRFPRTFRHHIAMLGLEGDAATGFEAVRAELDRDTEQAFAASDASGNATRASEPKGELVAAAYRGRARQNVLRDWHQWPKVADRVADAPGAFAETLWPWFEGALLDEASTLTRDIMYRAPLFDSGWDDDERERDRTMLGVATRLLTALGRADDRAFTEAVGRLVGDDRLRVHRVVARSFAALAGRYADRAVAYLLGDPRRLMLSTFGSVVGETVALLRALSPHLTTGQRAAVEAAVLAFAPPRPADVDEGQWTQTTDRARLRLMRGVENVSDTFEAAREEAEEAHPGLADDSVVAVGFAAVRPPVPTSGLAGEDEDVWIEVMDRVLAGDAAALAEANYEEAVPSFHVGSVEEQASAFEDAAKDAPDRAWSVLDRLVKDVRYEPFATALIGGVAASEREEARRLWVRLPDCVARFDDAGFVSPPFRYRASHALRRCPGGLSDSVLSRLESWFWEADTSVGTVSDPTEGQVRSLLFGEPKAVLGSDRTHVMEVLAAGCFHRPEPAFERWTSFARRIAVGDSDVTTAAAAARLSGDLFLRSNPDHARATETLLALVGSCPDLATHPRGLLGLAQSLRHLDPQERALDLMDLVRGLAWDQAGQAYGEMAVALHVGTRRPASSRRVREGIEAGGNVLRGLAFGAAALWVEAGPERPLALDVLRAAVASDDEHAAGAARRALVSFELGSPPRAWVPEDEELIRAVLTSDAALTAAVDGALAAAASRVRSRPALAHDLAAAVVRGVERGVFDRWALTQLAEPLLQIALTLHRLPAHRERGLSLFESVYTLGLGAARAAIQTLDRDPFRA